MFHWLGTGCQHRNLLLPPGVQSSNWHPPASIPEVTFLLHPAAPHTVFPGNKLHLSLGIHTLPFLLHQDQHRNFQIQLFVPIRQTFKRKIYQKADKTQLWKSWDNPFTLDKKSHQNKHTVSPETGFILKNYFFALLVNVTKTTCQLLSFWH